MIWHGSKRKNAEILQSPLRHAINNRAGVPVFSFLSPKQQIEVSTMVSIRVGIVLALVLSSPVGIWAAAQSAVSNFFNGINGQAAAFGNNDYFKGVVIPGNPSGGASDWQPVEGYRSRGSVTEEAMKRGSRDAANRERQYQMIRAQGPETNQIFASSAIIRIPTMANSPGQFGAFFKTRVSLLNVTDRSYTVYATIFNQSGEVKTAQTTLAAREQKTWDNFLEALSYSGAGAVEFDAWFGPTGGVSQNEFLVFAEVYTDSPSGRYKTIVEQADALDAVSTTFANFVPGIAADGSRRTNVGCFCDSFSSQSVRVETYSGNGGLLGSQTLNFVPHSWGQTGLTSAVSNGYLKFVPTTSSSFWCYAVVVDNQSNDGSFIPVKNYIP